MDSPYTYCFENSLTDGLSALRRCVSLFLSPKLIFALKERRISQHH